MKREITFAEEATSRTSLKDACGGGPYILERFPGYDGTGTRYFRLDGKSVSYFCRRDKADKSLYIIYDIVVRDDVSTLDLFRALDDKPKALSVRQSVLPFCEKIIVDIADNGRTYPSVEFLAIGSRVIDINVKNSQFPSVEGIREPSDNGHFVSAFNRYLLKKTKGGSTYILLNVFGPRNPNRYAGMLSYSHIMSQVCEIADYAMADSPICPLDVIGRNTSVKINKHSFDGCIDAVYDKNGILAAGGVIIDVAPGVSSVEIGNGKYMYINTALLGEKVRRVIIDTYYFPTGDVSFACTTADLVVEFSGKAEFVLNITNPLTNVSQPFFMAPRKCVFDKIMVSYDGYTTKDDIVYAKDGKTLVCAWNANGDISIPEGVETIATAAFIKSRVASVSLPKSLRGIGTCAFMDAENLKRITLPEGLIQISDNAFKGAGIREISIPKSCNYIGQNALDCADLIKAYPGGEMSISYIFRSREKEGLVVIENAETGKRYAFANGKIITSVFDGYNPTIHLDFIDVAWRGKDLDTFEGEVGNLYAHVSRKYLDTKVQLAVFAFANGYAPENARAYAKSHAFDFVAKCIENGNEKLAIEVIKIDGLLTKPLLKKLLPVASSAGMVEAAAVISERAQPKAKRATQAISL